MRYVIVEWTFTLTRVCFAGYRDAVVGECGMVLQRTIAGLRYWGWGWVGGVLGSELMGECYGPKFRRKLTFTDSVLEKGVK